MAQVRERLEGTIGIVELAGRMTVNDQPGLLRDAVTSVVTRGARHVLVDLSRVPYVDSTRLGELIAAHVTLSRHGGGLKLLGTPQRIVDLLTLAGLGGVFEQFSSLEDATRALGADGPTS